MKTSQTYAHCIIASALLGVMVSACDFSLSEEPWAPTVHPKTVPVTCEQGPLFRRIGKILGEGIQFTHDSRRIFYEGWSGGVRVRNLETLETISEQSFFIPGSDTGQVNLRKAPIFSSWSMLIGP